MSLERDLALEHEPVTAADDEQDRLKQIEEILRKAHQAPDPQRRPMLLGPDGEKFEIPETVFLLLREIVPHLLKGHALTVVPLQRELTTQDAADLLNVSRPFLIGLLERGEIPYVKTGKHRRIRFGDLMGFKKRREATRHQALDRLTELSQDYGLDRYQD